MSVYEVILHNPIDILFVQMYITILLNVIYLAFPIIEFTSISSNDAFIYKLVSVHI